MNREHLRATQWDKLSLLASCLSPFYEKKFSMFGGAKLLFASFDDFIQKTPLTTKAELLEDRLKYPPFGSNLTNSVELYTRFCQTSGTSNGYPMAWLDTRQSWESMLSCWQRVFEGADLTPGVDRIFFAFSFGPFLGFWTAYEAAARYYMVIPGGGLSSAARLEMMARYGATVLCCTPTYALRLGEMIGSGGVVACGALNVKKIIVAGEPGGSISEVRARIENLWGGRVYDHHGMTEVGPVSYEETAHPGQLAVFEESYLAEVINPSTGAEVEEGEEGELVLTTLDRTACPIFRYRTGDWVRKSFLNGRLALIGGVLSRVDDMVVVRGVNIYPSAIEAVVRQFDEVTEFMVEQRRVDAMDEITLLVEVPDSFSGELLPRLATRLRDTFSLRIPVILAASGSLPRHEFKAKRWRRV